MKKAFLTLICGVLVAFSYAQKSNGISVKYKENLSTPILITFEEEGNEISAKNVDLFLKNFYNMPSDENLVEIKRENDHLGFTHIRFQRTKNNVEVLGSILIAHFKNDKLQSVNGKYFDNLMNNTAQINESNALSEALKSVNSSQYYWEIPEEETLLKKMKNDESQTYFPKGKLVYAPINGDFNNEFALAYQFDIYSKIPEGRDYVYVNAQDGSILWKYSNLHHGSVVGKAVTGYIDTVSITTDSVAPNEFRMHNYTKGSGVITLNNQYTFDAADLVDFIDDDNFWDATTDDKYAGDAHFGAESAYDYFFEKHNRNSYNNDGAIVYTYVHYGSNFANATWNGHRLALGDGDGITSSFATMDIVGHELAHGVTEYTAGLIYQGESGALNESFSDIFGVAIEAWKFPNSFNYDIGEQIGITLRNMANPKMYGHPDTYKGNNWASTTGGDNGGVHTNSGVQNYWFYLLSEGGSGVNDNGDAYNVTAIGMEKAEQIAYRLLNTYLTQSSDYEEARMFGIMAANDIYEGCSPETETVTNAWYAVGLGDPYYPSVVANFIANSYYVCELPKLITFTNTSKNADTHFWTTPDGDNSSIGQLSYQFQEEGEYTVSITASSNETCFGPAKTHQKTIMIYELAPPHVAQCEPTTIDYCCEAGITNFQLNGINVTSENGSVPYEDFTCESNTLLKVGENYEYSITVGNTFSEIFKMYIDLNNDGIFSGNELIDSLDGVRKLVKSSINIPNNPSVVLGKPLRMRLMSDIVTNKKFLPCSDLRKGQTEDYSIILVDSDEYQLSTTSNVQYQFELYPNPATNIVSFNNPNIHSVSIFNTLGQKVWNTHLNGSQEFDISSLNSGIYFVELESREGKFSKKLIKK